MLFHFLTEPPLVLGAVALTGLALQGKRLTEIVEGTARTSLGFALVLAGSQMLLAPLVTLTGLLREATGARGVMPDSWGPMALLMRDQATVVSLGLVVAFLFHLLLARLFSAGGRRFLFLTPHNWFLMTGWFVAILPTMFSLSGNALGVVAGITAGLYCTVLPMIAYPFTRDLTDGQYTLGNIQTFNMILASVVGRRFALRSQASATAVSQGAAGRRDLGVLLTVLMPPVYVAAGLAAGQTAVASFAGEQHWVIWLVMNGVRFAVGIAVILAGTHMFAGSLLPAFEGIARRVMPGAIPALDSVIFFPLQPTGAILGFLGHVGFATLLFFMLWLFNSPLLVIPGPSQAFFEGALAGVFGAARGGWRGAVAAGVASGMLTHIGVIPLYYLQPSLQEAGVVFAVSDLVVLAPLLHLLKALFA